MLKKSIKNQRLDMMVRLKFFLLFALLAPFYCHAEKEKIVHETLDPIGNFWVFEERGFRCLASMKPPTSLCQTCVFLQNPQILALDYQKLILASLYFVTPKKILVVGLGGGTLIQALSTLCPDAEIDVVELHPETPRLAKDYFFFSPSEKTKIFIADGAKFISEKKETPHYDLIILDAFSGDNKLEGLCFPKPFQELSFVKKVKNLLTPEGVAVFNTIPICPFHKKELEQYMMVFSQLFMLENSGNKIIIAPKNVWGTLGQLKENSGKWTESLNQVGISQEWLLPKIKIFHSSYGKQSKGKLD
jgi:spermidine synthase